MMKLMTRYIMMVLAVALVTEAKAAKTMYARLTDDNQTLTFYYNEGYQDGSDMQVKAFTNSGQRGWNSYAADITKVVIDASFAEARPTSTAYWFCDCTKLATIEGLRNVNTSETTDMSFMFSGTALKRLSIGHFQTDKMVTMRCAFQGCSSLEVVEMVYLTPGASLQNVSKMFSSCTSLTTILCNADFSSVAQGDEMFNRCFKLKGEGETTFNASMISNLYARPDNTTKRGYFTTSKLVEMDDCNVTLSSQSYTYNGTARMPEVTVRKKADGSVVSTDCYSVSYEDHVNAGTARVIVSGADDSQSVSNFSIAKVKLTVSVTDVEKTYGEDVTLAPTISYEGFVNGEDASVLNNQGQVFFSEEIGQWTAAGKYKVYARYVRADNYEANYVDGKLTIHPKSIEGATVTIADYDHTGYAVTPEATVELSGYGTLKYYRDYDITATNNVNPGTATATITGKGNYTGAVQKTFTILDPNPLVDVSDCEVLIVEHDPYVYDGTEKKPEIRVRKKSDGTYLPTNAYNVGYEDNVNASGTPTVSAWGRGDTHISARFSIAKAQLTVSVTDVEKTYGEDVTLAPTISYEGFVNGEDVSVLNNQGQIFFSEEIGQWTAAGNYKVYARYVRDDNYEANYVDGKLTIHPKDIEGATVTIADYQYTGSPIIPEATVSLENYDVLKYYRDYDITAEHNVEPGTATAIITGKGNYTGTVEKVFNIRMYISGIDTVNSDSVTPDRWTDMQGRRVAKPQSKGLYIKNGKKVVVR